MKLIIFKGGTVGALVWICPDQVVRVYQSEPGLVCIDLTTGQSCFVQGTIDLVVEALTQ